MITIKRIFSLITALVMFCSVSFAAANAFASEPETVQSDENAVVSIAEYVGEYAVSVICDALHYIEIFLYRFDSLFSFLWGAPNLPVAVTDFNWSNAEPVLAKEDSSAFACTMALDCDVNFLELTSDITTWYEFSSNGIFWSEVKTDEYYTFVRNKFCQGYIYDAYDDSVRYNYLGSNLIIPSGTLFTFSLSGDASDDVASVYSLEEGTTYYIRLCMYVRSADADILYKSERLKCVR